MSVLADRLREVEEYMDRASDCLDGVAGKGEDDSESLREGLGLLRQGSNALLREIVFLLREDNRRLRVKVGGHEGYDEA